MPSYLLLFLQPQDSYRDEFQKWRKELSTSNLDITNRLYLDAVDVTETAQYRYVNVYRLANSEGPSDSQIEAHIRPHLSDKRLEDYHWQHYGSVTELRESSLQTTTVVTVGMTIPPDAASQDELDRWYTEEHIPGLATVPGWQASIRLRLLSKCDKDAEFAAPHLAMHEWSEPNELGGEAWKKAVFTPWTEKISRLQSAPMHRRVWKRV